MTSDADNRRQLLHMATGLWVSQAIHVAAKLGLADLLAAEPQGADGLAARTGTNAGALKRVLRALESVGIFAEGSDGRYHLTPLAEGLRDDVPGSLRAYAVMLGEPWLWKAWGELAHTVATGQSAFEKTHGKALFPYLKDNPDAGRTFNAAMSSRSRLEVAAILAAYSWPAGTVVDVGGGHGMLLSAILAAQPQVRGILFDLPQVIDATTLSPPEISARCKKVAGSFMEAVPDGGDLYILKRVLHDWSDADCVRILERIRAAMHRDARLVFVEHVLPSDGSPSHGKLLDLQMLVMTDGGRERSAAEYQSLLERAKLRLTKIIPTPAGISLVEAAPA
jgi:hypothetical protein